MFTEYMKVHFDLLWMFQIGLGQMPVISCPTVQKLSYTENLWVLVTVLPR